MRTSCRRFISLLLAAVMFISLRCEAFAQTLTLPTTPEAVEEEAFYGDRALDEAVIPYGTTTIDPRAFAYRGVKRVTISDTVTDIAEDTAAASVFLRDFAENKATGLSWISGYRILRTDMTKPRKSDGHKIVNLHLDKGDLMIVTYVEGHLLKNTAYAIAERITWGTGTLEFGFAPMFYGANLQKYTFIAERDMDVTVTSSATEKYAPRIEIYGSEAYVTTSDMAYLKSPQDETVQKRITEPLYSSDDSNPKPLSLLHLSDIHNSLLNANNVREFIARFGSYLDDAILTGDLTGKSYTYYMPIYEREGLRSVLLCIGNHDVYDVNRDAEEHGASYDNQAYWASNPQKYSQYFAANIDLWNVVQPPNAADLGLCYYYKDYIRDATYSYRLIVLDAMAYDDAQHNWFVSALADARTNGRTVVVAEHFPPIRGAADIHAFETTFMSLRTGMEHSYVVSRLTTGAGCAADAVDDFIDAGGEFACWLCGHLHYDQVAALVSHPNQIYIAVGTAHHNTVWQDMPRQEQTPSVDLMNVVYIDPKSKLIEIQRVGATIDNWGRVREHVTINYQTRELVAAAVQDVTG